MANDFKEKLSQAIARQETRMLGHCEEFEQAMAGYESSSFCAGFQYSMTLAKGVLTQMPDPIEIPDCKKCFWNDQIAWHQCENCLGQARNNFLSKEEVNNGR